MKALLFDFGGTLDSDGLTWKDRFHSIYKDEGVDAPPERFDRAFYDADDRLAERHALEGLSLRETVRLQVKDTLEHLERPANGVSERIADRFVEDCQWHLRRNRPLLEKLAKSFRLGIVSNFYGNLEGILAAEGLSPLFGAVADSARVGHIKPSPEIFLFAAKKLRAEAGDCLMVGDSIARDMKGAEDLGMKHALLTTTGRMCCAQAWTLRRLTDLETLLS
jgi:FMN phosphatase YigB (HAD superfamily)